MLGAGGNCFNSIGLFVTAFKIWGGSVWLPLRVLSDNTLLVCAILKMVLCVTDAGGFEIVPMETIELGNGRVLVPE